MGLAELVVKYADAIALGMNLGVDMYRNHDFETPSYLGDPDNRISGLNQRVDEAYMTKHKGEFLFETIKYAFSVPAFAISLPFYGAAYLLYSGPKQILSKVHKQASEQNYAKVYEQPSN
ncbi:MAG: hypothetical protein Q8O89_04560 [Nanoarchaeota archaeon]|nr:hypothetical protein [Nanoarchaeota archaeon]